MNNRLCDWIWNQNRAFRQRARIHLLLSALLLLLWMSSAWSKGPACPAYEQLRPLLNSERIQACFGSYGVEVLEQQGNLRISSLYSLAAGKSPDDRITRTLAISEFATEMPEALHKPYQQIRDGASMGATLEAAGWQVDKRHRYVGEVPVSTIFRCMSGLPADYPVHTLALQVYDLWVVRDDAEVHFALLAELHDPRYLTLQDLRQVYPGLAEPTPTADEGSRLMLQRATEACARH